MSFELHLLISSGTVVKKVRKGGVFLFSYNFILAKLGFSYVLIALVTLCSNENWKQRKMPCLSSGCSCGGVLLFQYSAVIPVFRRCSVVFRLFYWCSTFRCSVFRCSWFYSMPFFKNQNLTFFASFIISMLRMTNSFFCFQK